MESNETSLFVRNRGGGFYDIKVEPVDRTAEAMMDIDGHMPREDFSFERNEWGNFAIKVRHGRDVGKIVSKGAVRVSYEEDEPISAAAS